MLRGFGLGGLSPRRGSFARSYALYFEPVTQDVYYSHAEDITRVVFAKGVITAIEQCRI